MDRKGQTWSLDSKRVVFTVIKTHKPTPTRQVWMHEIVYLANDNAPEDVGKKQFLHEAISHDNLFSAHLRKIS